MRNRSKEVFSFDVFDTCLCRLCGEPNNMVQVLSKRVQQHLDKEVYGSETFRKIFCTHRVNAPTREGLDKTYEYVKRQIPIPLSVEELVEIELNTERDMLVPIQATKQRIDTIRSQKPNAQILFISDMYLHSSFIEEQLRRYGFFKEGDAVYVSDELGAWKRDKSLYIYIERERGLSPKKWHHYGDNRHADYTMPRQLGIHAHHLVYPYTEIEQKFRKQLDVDYPYSSIFAGICRATRLANLVPEDMAAFVSNVSAPLMMAWVGSIMTDAQRRGIQRLYFFARDTHGEYLMARQIQQIWFPNIEVRYLFISTIAQYKHSENTYRYILQEGMTDEGRVAIIDSNSSSRTTYEINKMMSSHGHKSIFSYFFVSDLQHSAEDYSTIDKANTNDVLFYTHYANTFFNKATRNVIGMKIFYELLFSLNFHKKTIDYEQHGSRLRPLFREDNDDKLQANNLRQLKRHNDTLLTFFADAYQKTMLVPYSNDILHRLAIPNFVAFVNYPHRDSLPYLNRIRYWGTPIVGQLNKKYVWKRGSIFYTLPKWMGDILRRKMIAKDNLAAAGKTDIATKIVRKVRNILKKKK